MAGALMDVELGPRVLRESRHDRLLLLGRDVAVGAAEVEEDRAPDLVGQAQGVRNGRAVIGHASQRVGQGGHHVRDTPAEAEAEDTGLSTRHLATSRCALVGLLARDSLATSTKMAIEPSASDAKGARAPSRGS